MGQQFQFDWGEADVKIGGALTRVYLFCMQLSASRKKFVRAYGSQEQESFLDGFVHAFEYFGGVPAVGLFDNLKTAVVKMLSGRNREEQESFAALRAHYVFEAEFCNVRSGNEKGQVENLVGYVRRNALTPLVEVASLEDLNSRILLSWCDRVAETDRVPHTDETVAAVYTREKEALHPLPAQPFEACRICTVKVSKMSTVTFDTNQYSVPCVYVGQTVWVKGFVDRVIVVAQNEVIATHSRCRGRQQMVLELDHYLEVLLKKPRAVRDARAMHDPRVPDVVRRVHAQMRARQHAEGDRLFVRFLLLHREIGMKRLCQALEEAERTRTYHYEGLHDLVMKLTGEAPDSPLDASTVPADLAAYCVQKVNVRMYDRLVHGGDGQ
nr:IS21 family transposase [Kyrpidia spormannii]